MDLRDPQTYQTQARLERPITHDPHWTWVSHNPFQPYPPLPLSIGHSAKKKKKKNHRTYNFKPTNPLTHNPHNRSTNPNPSPDPPDSTHDLAAIVAKFDSQPGSQPMPYASYQRKGPTTGTKRESESWEQFTEGEREKEREMRKERELRKKTSLT